MSWADDTDKILSDGLQNYVVMVKKYTSGYSSGSVYPTDTISTIETSTVSIFPDGGTFVKDSNGEKIKSTNMIIFPATSSVAVDHRVYEVGRTDYHEVLDVRRYEGHKQVYTKMVEGR